MKKHLAALLAVLMMLGCLTACLKPKQDTPEAPVSDATEPPVQETEPPAPPVDAYREIVTAIEKNQYAVSSHVNIKMDMRYTVSIPDANYSMDISLSTDMHTDANLESNTSRIEGRTTILNQSVDTISYTEKVDDAYLTYLSTDNGRTWTVTSQDAAAYNNMNDPAYMTRVWKDNIKEAQYVGTATVEGHETTLYTGTLAGEYIMFSAGALEETLSGYTKQDIEAMMQGLDDVPFEVNIDNETGYLVRFKADMSNAMSMLLENLMETELKKSGTNMQVKIRNTSISSEAIYSQFNEVPPVEIPAEAKAANH